MFTNRVVAAIVAVAICACAESTPPAVHTLADVNVASVVVTPSARTFRALNDTVRFRAIARNAAGDSIKGKTFIWSTSDSLTATVDATGLVTALRIGSATIKAAVGAIEASTSIAVDPWILVVAGAAGPGVPGTCGIALSGDVYCWGIAGAPLTPTLWTTSVKLAGLSGGKGYWCGTGKDGTAYCWGSNTYGQLGDGTRVDHAQPAPVSGARKFLSLATQIPVGLTGAHTCGLAVDSTAYCWGTADNGQIGVGAASASTPGVVLCNVSTAALLCAASPLQVLGGNRFRSLTAGSLYTCAVGVDAGLYCWGSGSGAYTGNGANIPTKPPLPLSFSSVSAKFEHSCGVLQNGDAYCWGSDIFGQLGGGAAPVTTGLAVKVAGGISFASVSVGLGFTCGLTPAGRGYCWGDNESGQLGVGTNVKSNVPVAVVTGLTFTSLVAGYGHTCGVVKSGAAYCWGSNGGQLGDGTLEARTVPVRVKDP